MNVIDATLHQFRGRILEPLYNLTCFSQEGTVPDCTPTVAKVLGCSNYSGVRCSAYQDTCPANSNVVATTTAANINALGTTTGLLTAAVVIVTMGWIVSCVYWQRKVRQR